MREEQYNDWHPLPMMIGNAIVADEPTGPMFCGKYVVEKSVNGTVRCGRKEDRGEDPLSVSGEWGVYDDLAEEWVRLEIIAEIEPPEDGWESETSAVRTSIFGGYR